MKKLLVVVVVVLAIALIGANAAFAGIANSKHDLSSTSTNTTSFHLTSGGISSCQFCHTPHAANTAVSAPLWNRSVNSGYQPYASVIPGATPVTAVGSVSLACLSCHDGTTSILNTYASGNFKPSDGYTNNGLGGVDGATGLINGATTNLTQDLRNDHPVGMAYTTTPPTIMGLVSSASVSNIFPVFSGNMECATCHDPHDTTNAPFLRSALSGFCTKCHANK